MSLEQIIKTIKKFFEIALETQGRVISVEKQEDGWLAIVETVEESAYMRERALNDVVGLYEVKINEQYEVSSYKRVGLRDRTSTKIENEDTDD